MTNKDIGDQLWQLYEILHGCSFCKDLSALSQASDDCRKNNSKDYWKVEIAKLLFEIDKYNVVPTKANDIELEFSIISKGKVGTIEIVEYEFNIVITGFFLNSDSTDFDKAICSWHFDLQPEKTAQNKDDKFMHPKFHFQHGGKNIKSLQDELGRALIMASPRLAHPPMDVVLGIDFILTNFIHKDKTSPVRETSKYKKLVKEAQKRYWKPYFDAISSTWTTLPDPEGFAFHPQLIS